MAVFSGHAGRVECGGFVNEGDFVSIPFDFELTKMN